MWRRENSVKSQMRTMISSASFCSIHSVLVCKVLIVHVLTTKSLTNNHTGVLTLALIVFIYMFAICKHVAFCFLFDIWWSAFNGKGNDYDECIWCERSSHSLHAF